MSKDEFLSVPLPMIEWKHPIRDFTQEDTKNMATSLRVHGQIQPVVCNPPDQKGFYEGVCGRLRYEGAKYGCIPEVLVRVHEFKSESEVRAWQLAENLHRKELMAIQRAEGYKQLYESLKEEVGGIKDEHIVSTIAEMEEKLTGGKTSKSTIYDYMRIAELPREVKAKITVDRNFGLEHAKHLLRLKDKHKQLILADEFLDSAYKGKPMTVREFKKKVNKILNPPGEAGPLPEGVFDIIYADPPWRYDVHLRGYPDYQTMAADEICKLEVPQKTAENAVLFLWTTNPMLDEALKVMEAWGFKYKTNMVWVKNKMGLGFWFRGQHELLLVAVKGDVHPPEESNRFPSVLIASVGEHSEKPSEVYDIIEKMHPNRRYLELYARKKREGWSSWGNEV